MIEISLKRGEMKRISKSFGGFREERKYKEEEHFKLEFLPKDEETEEYFFFWISSIFTKILIN